MGSFAWVNYLDKNFEITDFGFAFWTSYVMQNFPIY